MDVTSSIIYDLLSKKYSVSHRFRRSTNIPVNKVRKFRGEPPEQGCLYLVDGSEEHPLIEGGLGCSFLLYHSEADAITLIDYQADVAFVEGNIDGYDLMEAVQKIFQEFQEWINQMKDALIDNLPLEGFMPLGQKMILRPYALLDHEMTIIYVSPGFLESRGEQESGLRERINELMNDEEFPETVKWETIFSYPPYACEKQVMGINVFDGKQHLARILMPVFWRNQEIDPGESRLFQCFGNYVSKCYLRYTEDILVRRQNDHMHKRIREMLYNRLLVDEAMVEDVLGIYGWRNSHDYILIKLQIAVGAKRDAFGAYISEQLEKQWNASCAVKFEDHIIWVVNLSLGDSNQSETVFFQTLAYIVRENALKAGASEIFRGFNKLFTYYLQADTVLLIGLKKNPHFWYYRFEHYALDYMLMQLTKEFAWEQLCHKGLWQLWQYDRRYRSQYVKTLETYIICEGNSTLAANKLFIHRSTFFRRMERIAEIADLDLDNPDEILHLILSLRIMKKDSEPGTA